MPRKQIVHVARQAIASNLKHGRNDPVIIVRTGSQSVRAHEVELVTPAGEVLGRFTYSPDKPLPCGARVWLELDPTKLIARPVVDELQEAA